MQNIISQLNERSRILNEEDLYSPLVRVYLNNLLILKSSFKVFDMHYQNSCEEFEKRFNLLEKSARELILTNDFQQVAEVILKISRSSDVLKDYLGEQIEEAYYNTIKALLKHLGKFSEKADFLLQKHRLTDQDIEILKNNMEIIRSAKENFSLQDRVSTCIDMMKRKAAISHGHNKNWISEEILKDLNEIHHDFILKIVKYFDEIKFRIEELFRRNKDYALEDIQKLVDEMDSIRTIEELELRTAGAYYSTVENIRGYMRELQIDAEQLLPVIDHQLNTINYRRLAQSLSRLKNAKWIDRISQGEHDALMGRIKEELVHHASQLEERLMKLDYSLKYPENVLVAHEIVDKIESMHDLQYSIPELEKHRKNVVERFFKDTQTIFDRIQKTLNLQDRDIYRMKQDLKNLQEIKREYDNLQPAHIHLRKHGYSDVTTLHRDIEQLKNKYNCEIQAAEAETKSVEMELEDLNSIIEEYMKLSSSEKNKSITERLSSVLGKESLNKISLAQGYLMMRGYSDIQAVYNKLAKTNEVYGNNSQQSAKRSRDFHDSLDRLESIFIKYDLLLAENNSMAPEAISFLLEKDLTSYESLIESIQEKKRIIDGHEKNKRSYHFNDSLDALIANNALIYVSNCEKVGHHRIRECAIDTNENLQKYIREYGNFLNQEIERKFSLIQSINVGGAHFQHSQDLELRLDELLLSLKRFTHVFECINGEEGVQRWRRIFHEYYLELDNKMKECRDLDTSRKLKDLLIIAHALSCIDRFFPDVFATSGFKTLYKQYQEELNKECRESYRIVLDYISKADYANVDIVLSNIDDGPLNLRDKAQIQHDLQNSLKKLMDSTKSIANWLDGKIEREGDNWSHIKEVKNNLDKIRIASNKHNILDLLDAGIRDSLENFEEKIKETLAAIIFKGLLSIETFMNADSFSEAEQGMENLSRVQRELTDYCTSKEVLDKSQQLQERLSRIADEILRKNDFADITKYYMNPPNILLEKLKMIASHGNARFTLVYNSMLQKVTESMTTAINDGRNASVHECSTKIRALNNALCFLPEDLKERYALQINEIAEANAKTEEDLKQDLEKTFADLNRDDQTIKKLGELAKKYKRENMTDLFQKLCERTRNQMNKYCLRVKDSLERQNIPSAFDGLKKITAYKEILSTHLPEIEQSYNTTSGLILKEFSDCGKILSNIFSTEQTTSIEKAFKDILTYLKCFNRMEKTIETKSELENVEEGFQKVSEYLNENSKRFQSAMEEINTVELDRTISIAKK